MNPLRDLAKVINRDDIELIVDNGSEDLKILEELIPKYSFAMRKFMVMELNLV